MDIIHKTKVLGSAGKWDVCASSASNRKISTNDRIGDAAACGICHSFTENGRCISLFKTLLTNNCTHDCKYCQNSTHCKSSKAIYEPEELAKIFMNLYVKNYVEGLFLSSGIMKDSDFTTEKMLDCVKLLREKYKFHGYIHFKVLPGTSIGLIKQASIYSDRMSINLEAPSSSRLSELSQIKDYKSDILRRQSWIKRLGLPSGHTTQLVVGGSGESDWEILRMINWEYSNMSLKRAYYSAFTPIHKTPFQNRDKTPYEREHRLYNVDFMLRKYNIHLDEFKDIMDNGNLPKGDPKMHLARNYFDSPVDINTASKEELLRVPGIGPLSASRIIGLQNENILITRKQQLQSIGVVLKRAETFLRINGYSQKTLGEFTA